MLLAGIIKACALKASGLELGLRRGEREELPLAAVKGGKEWRVTESSLEWEPVL